VQLHHFGDLRDRLADGIIGHGPYDSAALPALLHDAGIAVVLLPGPYAETYGLVMSEALHAGLPVIGPYYGAVGERIRAHDSGWTIDPDDPDSLPTLLRDLERCRLEVLRATRRARSVQLDEAARSALGYRDHYRSGAERPDAGRAEDETPA
jgi:glycogen(starch) synthase